MEDKKRFTVQEVYNAGYLQGQSDVLNKQSELLEGIEKALRISGWLNASEIVKEFHNNKKMM